MTRRSGNATPEQDEQHRLLIARRCELAEQLADLRQQMGEVISATADANSDDEHDPEGSTIAFERSQLATLIASASAELDAAGEALTRLDEGHFGQCERCGQPIGAERLAARPATRRCVSCAALSRAR